MTRPSLADIEARAEGATEGPWRTGRAALKRADLVVLAPDHLPAPYVADYVRDDDATFISAARTDVPALTAAIRAVLALISGEPAKPGWVRLVSQADIRAALAAHLDLP